MVLSGVYESVLGKLLIHKLDLLLQFAKLLLLGFVLKLSLDCDLFNLEVLHEEICFFKLKLSHSDLQFKHLLLLATLELH